MSRTTSTAPGSHDPAAAAVGVQPERAGRLVCLECGRGGFRSLSAHVRPAHGLSPAAYREKFELAATAALVVPELSKTLSVNLSGLLTVDPRVQAGMQRAQEPARRARSARAGRRRAAETLPRQGRQLALQARGAQLAQSARDRAEQTQAELDEAARGHGFEDLGDLLRSTAGRTATQVAIMLGWSRSKVAFWRGRFGVRGVSKSAAAAERRRLTQQTPGDVVSAPGAGVQPVGEGGLLQCLECGAWQQDLGVHVVLGHQLPQALYRRRHGLARDVRLVSAALADVRRRQARQALQAAREPAARAHRQQSQAHWDERARGIGYLGIVDALQRLANRQLAEVLRLDPRRVAVLRERFTGRLPAATGAGQASQARAAARWDERAQAAGYPDIAHAVAMLDRQELMAALAVSPDQATRLRQRYLP